MFFWCLFLKKIGQNLNQGGQIMPTKQYLQPRIFRPSDGPDLHRRARWQTRPRRPRFTLFWRKIQILRLTQDCRYILVLEWVGFNPLVLCFRNPCPLMHLHWRARWQTQPRRPQPRISSNVTPCTIFMFAFVMGANWWLGIQAKLYIPSTINIWKKVLTKAIWADKNGLVSDRLACASTKTEILNKIDYNPEFFKSI